MSAGVGRFLERLTRKKILDADILETPLKRCLSLFDLVLLGIGHMVGAGIFLLTGTVARNIAGPGIVLSYLLAGVAALLSALCYAEFGARVPKAGSAYTYTYVTIGELCAFLIGWNMILENLIGAASVAKTWSASFDALFNGAIKNGTLEHIGSLDVPLLSSYLDFIALGVVIVVVIFVAAGAKVSTTVNSVLTIINLAILCLIIGLGFYLANVKNWTNKKLGGFLPYGFSGVIAGAGTCFYAYIGFEGIAIAGEEAKNPARTIPMATGLATVLVSLLYIGCSATLTLMIPYNEVDVAAPFPTAFGLHGNFWAKRVVAVGALVGISTSLLGSLFTLPRSIYAMASDGLLFRALAYVHSRTQTPILSIFVFGLVAGVVALLVDLEILVELLSIGTLLSFTIVAASVIVLHYQPVEKCQFQLRPDPSSASLDQQEAEPDMTSDKKKMMKTSQSHDDIGKLKKRFLQLPVLRSLPPGRASIASVVLMTVFMVSFWLLVLHGTVYLRTATWWSILLLSIITLGLIFSFLLLCVHEQNTSFLTFQVPLAPLLPALSMMLNIGMMLQLNRFTWIRLAVWIIIGFVIYFGYGVWHSSENDPLLPFKPIVSYSSGDVTSAALVGGHPEATPEGEEQKPKKRSI